MTGLLKQFGPKEVKEEKFVQYSSPLNPFNSWKIFYHVERMKKILSWLKGDHSVLPPPVYVTVDPTNVCNHACFFCISADIQESDNTTLKASVLTSLASVLNQFETRQDGLDFSVKAIVLAGGGEPLVNKATPEFLRELAHYHQNGGAEFSMITNGELLTDEVSEIMSSHGTWIGFSVDSGNTEAHKRMHASKKKNIDNFSVVIRNIKSLCEKRNNFGRKIPLNVGYKFNIHPDSVDSMVEAASIAKEIDCDEIQFKPTFVDNAFEIMPPIIDQAQNNIMQSRKLYEDSKFRVIGQMHKFGPAWSPNHDFGACTMTPLGLIFSADGNMYLCCDRRGDPTLSLGPWHDGKVARLDMIRAAWGSEKHRELIKAIQTKDCPRCTLYFYNKVANEAIEVDSMNRNFL